MDVKLVFDLLNESLVYVGTGIFGLAAIAYKGDMNNLLKFVGITSITGSAILLLYRTKQLNTVNHKNVVFVTGCDSGLGFTIASKCHHLGMTVVAACLKSDSEGALKLKKHEERMFVYEMDVTKEETIYTAFKLAKDLVKKNEDYVFTALVNNAGVMCFGEFEWQTEEIIDHQIEVNLLGTMKTTRQFLPLLRKFQGRIVNVTSHCSLQALPGLSTYTASKAGLRFWNEALRMEVKKYGVEVVNFIPGSFVMSSNISARQQDFAYKMWTQLTNEQRQFYGKYFHEYHEYLNVVSGYKPVANINNNNMMDKFVRALLEENPSTIYKCEPMRYKIYHFLFSISPVFLRDWLVKRFICMPGYKAAPTKIDSN